MKPTKVTVLSDGAEVKTSLPISYISIEREVNRIPCAEIGLVENEIHKEDDYVGVGGHFEPGKEITIKFNKTPIFKGIVVKQALKSVQAEAYLSITLKGASIKLTKGRKNALFIDKKDSEVIESLIKDAGLTSNVASATKITHKELVQYYCTNWDFIMTRAEVNGLMVYEDSEQKIQVIAPELKKEKKTFDPKKVRIHEIDAEIDNQEQYKEIESFGWDVKEQKPTPAKKAKNFKATGGPVDPEKQAKAIGATGMQLVSGVSVDPLELEQWANAQMVKGRLSLLKGKIRVDGESDVKLGETIKIARSGKLFNGTAIVTGISHLLDVNGWVTDYYFGAPAEWYADRENISDTPAAGLIPPVHGLQIGVVDKFEEDPDKYYRVKVKLPALGEKAKPVWARLSSIDAGNGRGMFFRPESGDEVIVGFFNDDPRQPVILGSMFNEKNVTPWEVTDKNMEKGIKSREGNLILFDDENNAITIQTVEKNKIILDEKNKVLEIEDGVNKNSIKMGDGGIVLKTDNDLELDIKGKFTIKAGEVGLKSKGKVEIEGSSIDMK